MHPFIYDVSHGLGYLWCHARSKSNINVTVWISLLFIFHWLSSGFDVFFGWEYEYLALISNQIY